MSTEFNADELVTADTDRNDSHEYDDRSIRDCCSGLRDGYAEAWTEAESRRD
jgi:hypothetical protein